MTCEHPDGAIKSMAPSFPGEWSCTRCGQRFMPQNEAEPVFTRQEPPSSWGDEAARIRRQFLDPIEKPRSLMDILGDLGI